MSIAKVPIDSCQAFLTTAFSTAWGGYSGSVSAVNKTILGLIFFFFEDPVHEEFYFRANKRKK